MSARDDHTVSPGPEHRFPRPNYGAIAPSDRVGALAVREMLEDLEFPRTAAELRERAGNWRVPTTGPYAMVRLDDLMEGVPDNDRFRTVDDAVRRITRRNHGL